MYKTFFHKSRDIVNKLLVIIHANKMSIQKRKFILKQNLEFLLEPPIKAEGHLIMYLQ
jgi:hypothetical protein